MKTREEELVGLLDILFESGQEPNWSKIQLLCFVGRPWATSAWFMTELLRLMWLANEDQAAFDEAIWRLTNGAE